MRRLPAPTIDFCTALTEATNGIGSATTQANYRAQITNPNAVAIEAAFQVNAQAAMLYSFPRIASGAGDPVIHGNLRKSDLTQLYTQYFVPKEAA